MYYNVDGRYWCYTEHHLDSQYSLVILEALLKRQNTFLAENIVSHINISIFGGGIAQLVSHMPLILGTWVRIQAEA